MATHLPRYMVTKAHLLGGQQEAKRIEKPLSAAVYHRRGAAEAGGEAGVAGPRWDSNPTPKNGNLGAGNPAGGATAARWQI